MEVDGREGSGGIGKDSDSSLANAEDGGDEDRYCEKLGGRQKNDTTINSYQNRGEDHGSGDNSGEAGEPGMCPLVIRVTGKRVAVGQLRGGY